MGSKVSVACKCGLDTSILIGGGRDNHMTTCYFPCLCEQCHTVVEVNILDEPIRCPQCKTTEVISYEDPELLGRPGENTVVVDNPLGVVWLKPGRRLELTNGDYKCPQCGQMTLRFRMIGLWD